MDTVREIFNSLRRHLRDRIANPLYNASVGFGAGGARRRGQLYLVSGTIRLHGEEVKMGLADRDYMRDRAREQQEQYRSNARRSSASNPEPNWKTAVLVILVVGAVSWAAYRMNGDKPALPFPATGQVNWYVPVPEPRHSAPLTITAPPGHGRNYVVKLSEWNSGRLVAIIPVRGGETAQVGVPLGEYLVTIAAGKKWQGPERLFGRSGEVKKAVDPMHFFASGSQRTGHRIDLAERIDGNLKTRPVGPMEN